MQGSAPDSGISPLRFSVVTLVYLHVLLRQQRDLAHPLLYLSDCLHGQQFLKTHLFIQAEGEVLLAQHKQFLENACLIIVVYP